MASTRLTRVLVLLLLLESSWRRRSAAGIDSSEIRCQWEDEGFRLRARPRLRGLESHDADLVIAVDGRNETSPSVNDSFQRSPNRWRASSRTSIGSRQRHKGRITFDFGARSTCRTDNLGYSPSSSELVDTKLSALVNSNESGKIHLSVDAGSLGRLMPFLVFGCSSLISAFMGTLRLLGPLILSRRVINSLGYFISDYLTGRYFRKTYTRLEKVYLNYYETPAIFRALCRTSSQFFVLYMLAKAMGWLVGISSPPCRSEGRGLAFFCALLWVGSCVGTGHAFATAVALWGGPLRLQAVNHPTRTRMTYFFTRPWHILQWMQNPEAWINMISAPDVKPFDPNPLIFPATWVPLRLLQMCAVAKVMSTEPSSYIWCSSDVDQIPKLLRQYLLQLALCDEWYRVFLGERRVGLGMAVAFSYVTAMSITIVTSYRMNVTATLFMLPSLIAIIISGWMNIIIFWNRGDRRWSRAKRKTHSIATRIS